jgi:hypothetical protein
MRSGYEALGVPVKGTFKELAETIMARPPRLGAVRLVAVDGRAGSGKTTFAGRLTAALREAAAVPEMGEVAELHTDDFLDGWGELLAWQPRLRKWVFEPFRRGEAGAYRRYDWVRERLGEQWTPMAVPRTLVLEGVGSAAAGMRADLTLAAFVQAPRELRLARGLERDGERLRPQWERWMAHEDVHFAADRTAETVDLLVDGAPRVGHDPQIEYIIGSGG